MQFARQSGILLHPTSLPGGHGVGDLGPETYAFVDFLAAAKQTLWQVLPLGPTGYGDSPYQCFSAFAGNPLLVSLELLPQEGWLDEAAFRGVEFVDDRASYEAAQAFKLPLLALAAQTFSSWATAAQRAEFVAFCTLEGPQLDNFALFMAAKRLYRDVAWYDWDAPHRDREPGAMAGLRETEAAHIHAVKFAPVVLLPAVERSAGAVP